MAKHETHETHGAHEAHEATPHDAAADVTTAARTLLSAAERLGPRITAHAPGCPAEYGGACTCGSVDFLAAMHTLGVALAALAPQNGG